jgi:hypothetical protein
MGTVTSEHLFVNASVAVESAAGKDGNRALAILVLLLLAIVLGNTLRNLWVVVAVVVRPLLALVVALAAIAVVLLLLAGGAGTSGDDSNPDPARGPEQRLHAEPAPAPRPHLRLLTGDGDQSRERSGGVGGASRRVPDTIVAAGRQVDGGTAHAA